MGFCCCFFFFNEYSTFPVSIPPRDRTHAPAPRLSHGSSLPRSPAPARSPAASPHPSLRLPPEMPPAPPAPSPETAAQAPAPPSRAAGAGTRAPPPRPYWVTPRACAHPPGCPEVPTRHRRRAGRARPACHGGRLTVRLRSRARLRHGQAAGLGEGMGGEAAS